MAPGAVVLGSRSPQRLALLRQLLPESRIRVLPPRSPHELDFDGLDTWPDIESRLHDIVADKAADVLEQLQEPRAADAPPFDAVIVADTMIVASGPDDRSGRSAPPLIVLGQPPAVDGWEQTVRHWFRHYYAGRSHVALTQVRVESPDGRRAEALVRTTVTFHPDVERWLDWYLDTGEPLGKAGGYALQGAGGLFVARTEGSLSNVIGLPLRELLELFRELDLDVVRSRPRPRV